MSNKRFTLVIIALTILIFGWASYGLLFSNQQEESHHISVVLPDSNSDRWTMLKKGLEQGAEDYHLILNFVTTDSSLTRLNEETLINREISETAEGIIFEPLTSSNMVDMLDELKGKTKILLIGSDVTPENVYDAALADSERIGQQLAQAVIEDYGDALPNHPIILLTGTYGLSSMEKCAAAFQETIQAAGGTVEKTLPTTSMLEESLAKLLNEPSGDIVVALGAAETESATNCVLEASRKVSLYGEGYSEQNIYYLDKGTIRTLIVPDDFTIGYYAAAMMSRQFGYDPDKMEMPEISILTVNQKNLFDKENEKLLFPVVE